MHAQECDPLTMVEPGDILSLYQSTYSNILDQLQLKDLFKGKEASQTSGGGYFYLAGRGSRLLAQAPWPAQGTIAGILVPLQDEALEV